MVCINSINISIDKTSIRKGEWAYASAQIYPESATCTDLVWESSNSDVASVGNGHIWGEGVGQALIYARATDGSGTVSNMITVTVSSGCILVESINITDSSIPLKVGETAILNAIVYPANADNQDLVWSSNNTSVAEVDGNMVRAKSSGHAVITACSTDGSEKRDCCDVYVSTDIMVKSIEVSPSELTLIVKKSAFLRAEVCPSNATKPYVTWFSGNMNVAEVNPCSGMVTAIGVGHATIWAKSVDGGNVLGKCELTVTNPNPVESIYWCETVSQLKVGDEFTFKAAICPEDATNKKINWISTDDSVATINQSGKLKAVGVGETTVHAISAENNKIKKYINVSVKPSDTSQETKLPPTKPDQPVVEFDPIDVRKGAHLLSNTVMTLFGGQGLKLKAEYDSTKLASGVLGKGWYHNFEKRVEICDCEARVYDDPSSYSVYECSSADPDTFICTLSSKNGYVLTVTSSAEYPYTIDCNSAHKEYYNAAGQLAKIEDHQGFVTLITYSADKITIKDAVSNKCIYLEKDTNGRVVRVYDDASRQATFTYTGDLITGICDVNGNTLTYTYNEDGQTLTGTDSKGVCYFTNTYDECGRIITQKDAIPGTATSVIGYCDCTRVSTDRNGNANTRVFNDLGQLVSFTDRNGNTTTYTYDERHNVLKETYADGSFVEKTYNSFNKPTSIRDKNGNTTFITYDAKGNVTKITYPSIGGVIPEETFVYNERNQIIQHTDRRGTTTVYTYDAAGMPRSKKVGSRNAIVYTYENGLLVSQVDALGNTTRFGHNNIGQVTSITDAENHVTAFEYDAAGNLLKTTDADGKTIVNTYDGNHQKTSVTDANGYKTEYSYNGNMKNDMITLPDGNKITYEFDAEDRPVRIIDQSAGVTTMSYDKGGRLLSKSLPDTATVSYEYDAVGNVVKETNPKGAELRKTYDAQGNVLSVTDDEGNVTRYQYNSMSKVIRATNARSGATVYEYSPAGDLLSETDPLGNKKTYTYDAFGNKLTEKDAKNNITTYTYDANGNLLTVRDALNNVTTYTYNSLSQLVSVKDARNNTVRFGYDALGRRTTVTDAKNNVFTTYYDANGNVIKTTDAKGNTVSETVYNNLNLPTSVKDGAGKATTYTYNALGKVASVTDALNNRKEYTYDSRGQNTRVRDSANGYSNAEYDLLGNITRLSGPLGGAVNYSYDDMGRLISETTSSGGTVTYGYNELNVKDEITNARGHKRSIFYDAKGRITGYTCPEGAVSYTYDANGNVLTVTDENGTITREYDALNRVTKYTDTFGRIISYEYDAVGNLTKLVYPDNTAVNYAYDANNNLISVTDWANRTTTYTYDANNRVVGVTKPNGSVTTTVYDNMQRVTSTVERTASGNVITGFEYTYDDLSRVVEEKDLAICRKMCYTYDNLSRVVKRTTKDLCDNVISEESFSYDAAGNITDAPDSCFQYDVNNRLTSFCGNTVTYDLDGNMLSNGTQSFVYDSSNRLTWAGGHEYTYNAENVRIVNHGGGHDTTYTYNTNCRLSQLLMKSTDFIVTKYVYGLGLIGEEKLGCFKTYHFDMRGSTVAITDMCGNVIDTFKYDTYGKVTEHIGNSFVIFGYNGRDGVVTDKNGLIYMRARYYSPVMKRFVNADILHGTISDSTSLNRYSYVNGNPVSFVDPFGLSAEDKDGDENNKEKNLILILYDPDFFSRQAESELEYLKSQYKEEIIKIGITSKDNFYEVWEEYSSNVVGISLIFHGSPNHIWVGDNFMAEDVKKLEKVELNFFRLLSCNGGHKDVPNNIANSFKDNHNITSLYAMDGNLSFYPLKLFGYDYSKYKPRLSYDQDGFRKYASKKTKYIIPKWLLGGISITKYRDPTGLYLVN